MMLMDMSCNYCSWLYARVSVKVFSSAQVALGIVLCGVGGGVGVGCDVDSVLYETRRTLLTDQTKKTRQEPNLSIFQSASCSSICRIYTVEWKAKFVSSICLTFNSIKRITPKASRPRIATERSGASLIYRIITTNFLGTVFTFHCTWLSL